MHWFKKSIIRKILLAHSIFLLLIFCIFGFYLNTQVRDYFETVRKEELSNEAGRIAIEIEMFMQKYIIITSEMMTNTDFINITKDIRDRSDKQKHPLYARVTKQLDDIAMMDENIALSYIALDEASDIVTNQYGYEIRWDFDLSKRPWYIETIQAGKVTVTNPYIDIITNKKVITIAVPIIENGKNLGAFGLDLMIDDLYKMMKTHHIGQDGYAMILDKNEDILYHPEYQEEMSEKPSFNQAYGITLDKLISNEKGVRQVTINNKAYFVAYSPIENANWSVVTVIPIKEVFAPLHRLMQIFYLALIAIIVITVLLVCLLQFSISKPIVVISREIEGYSNNNRTICLPQNYFKREDEIGILTKGLSFMTKKMAQYMIEIEHKNIKLSEEINKKIKIQTRLEMILKLLSKTDEGIFIVDQNYVCLYCNSAFEKISGYSQDDLRNHQIIDDMIHLHKELLNNIYKNKQVKEEIEYQNAQGQTYYLFLKIDAVQYNKEDYYIGSVIDITNYKQREKDVYELKYLDSLTKLRSKTYFEEFFKKLLHQENLMCALIIININDFRLINEAKGYEFGNKVLVALSEKLKKFEEKNDCLARLGNDEFAILKTNIKSINDLYTFVTRLDQEINSKYYIDLEEVYIAAGIGVGIYPKDADSFDVLLKTATSALNSAKRSKANRFEFYNKDINKQSMQKYELQNKMRNALLQHEFSLKYQPQIDMQSGQIIGMEALIRWKPQNSEESIMPYIFIPLAEESAMILQIGEWVLREACYFGHKLYSQGHKISIGVNLSRIQFKEPYIISLIHSVLKETRLPANLLELEITEGILMENQEECERILNELKSMGVKIAIDDFGTGYSSLSYLKKFAVDKIKIDRSFIKDIPNSDNGIIAKIIIELAENLNLSVIAEGVETQEQVDFLIKNHCNQAQGFLFAKPLNEEETLQYLES